LTVCDRIRYRGYSLRPKQAEELEISCIILAGGKSRRYGHDKILEKIGTTSLLEKAISCAGPLSKEIIIVTANERSFAEFANVPKVQITSDILPGQGSLGGIYTGLTKSKSLYNLVVAADMPFLNEALLRYMMEKAVGFDITLPKNGGLYEPLHAIYSRNCLPAIKKMLDEGNRIITDLLNYVKVRYIEAAEVEKFDPRHLSFFNINTQEDMEKAKQIAGEAQA
jgi:molybdenum cofactor guanylyltransferase